MNHGSGIRRKTAGFDKVPSFVAVLGRGHSTTGLRLLGWINWSGQNSLDATWQKLCYQLPENSLGNMAFASTSVVGHVGCWTFIGMFCALATTTEVKTAINASKHLLQLDAVEIV
jgi:hypothetical protein